MLPHCMALAFAVGMIGQRSELPQRQPADLLLHNGKIVTVDDAFSIRRAVAVRGDKIVAVGGNELVARFDAAKTIDLGGKTVIPGFIDTHIHISGRAGDITQSCGW